MIDINLSSYKQTRTSRKVPGGIRGTESKKRDKGVYPDWVGTSKRHFFTFFLLTLTQPLGFDWTGTNCWQFCSEGEASLSESEEEGACERFCDICNAERSIGLAEGGSFAGTSFSSFESFSSSSELKESISSMWGGSHGFQLFDLDFHFLFFVLSRNMAHEFWRCPIWWQWRHRKVVLS